MTGTTNKLKILCLHGMVQNGTVFRKKTAVLRKKLDKIADLGKKENENANEKKKRVISME